MAGEGCGDRKINRPEREEWSRLEWQRTTVADDVHVWAFCGMT